MEIKRSRGHVTARRWARTFLAGVSALLLVAGLSLALGHFQARAQSADSNSTSSPEAATAIITSQIRSPNRDAYVTQKTPLTITGIAWREGTEPPYVTGDVFLEVERTTERAYLLQWNAVPSATQYLVEEATDQGFSDPETLYYGLNTEYPQTQSDGTYYYRVTADAAGLETSRWSNVVSVTVPWPATATGASASAAESGVTAESSITVQVSIDDGDWHTATVSETAWGGEWSYVWSSMPEERNTQHAIHTRAAEAGGDFGPVDSITITLDNKSHLVYLPVVLRRWPPINYPPSLSVSGLENDVDEDGEYELSWTYSDDNPAVPAPISYTLQEAMNSGFSSPTNYTVTTTSQSFTDKDDGTYYYRVRGNNIYGPGQWSNVVSVAVVSSDFYDDFSSAASGWLTHEANRGLVGCDRGDLQQNPDYKYNLFYEGGRYKVNIPLDCRAGGNHGDTRHIYPVTFAPGTERPASRTCLQLKGGFEKEPGWLDPWWSFWGLVFAASEDKSTVYSLEVNSHGNWGVVKRTGYDFPGPNHPWENETRTYLVPYTIGERWPARPAFEGNTVRAEVNGNNVKLFINGRLVHEFWDSQISSLTKVGIIGGDWEITPTQIGYDYFYLDEGCDDF